MSRRSKIWWWAAVLFTALNVGGAVFAAMQGQVLHADIHGGLSFLGAYLVWRLRPVAPSEARIRSEVG